MSDSDEWLSLYTHSVYKPLVVYAFSTFQGKPPLFNYRPQQTARAQEVIRAWNVTKLAPGSLRNLANCASENWSISTETS